MQTGWKCEECGLVWAPWFRGPCTHDEGEGNYGSPVDPNPAPWIQPWGGGTAPNPPWDIQWEYTGTPPPNTSPTYTRGGVPKWSTVWSSSPADWENYETKGYTANSGEPVDDEDPIIED